MERNIEINGHDHIIKGQWVNDGMTLIFKGEAVNLGINKMVLSIEYSFPFSFQRKYGTTAMEDEIVTTIKDHLEQKV